MFFTRYLGHLALGSIFQYCTTCRLGEDKDEDEDEDDLSSDST